MYRLLTIVLFVLVCFTQNTAQSGLACNGSMYRVIEQNADETVLQKINIQYQNRNLHLEELARYDGHRLNGICFHPKSSSIYGIRVGEPYKLFRIDQGLQLSVLKTLPLPKNLFFVAADIMPDGRHMVVLGFGKEDDANLVAIIDLEDPNFETEIFPLKQEAHGHSVVCADIAFHPTTGLLYGFDQRSNRMIQIDLEERKTIFFDQEVFGSQIGVVPSLFFDMDARLFGFTIGNGGSNSQSLFEFDKTDGSAQPFVEVGSSGSQDACSCPYQVHMYQSINNVSQYTCTEAQFTIKLVNRTPIVQTGLSLVDTLPEGFKIKSIDYNPFNSVSGLSQEERILNFSGFDLPIGEDSIVYTVSISQKARLGYHENQAWLTKENPDTRSNLRNPLRSDDPKTLVHQDPTGFILDELFKGSDLKASTLCIGESLSLDPNILGGKRYQWNTGALTPSVQIDQPGTYEVEIETSCGAGTVEFDIKGSHIDVSVQDEILVDPNEPFYPTPHISSTEEIESIFWRDRAGIANFSCHTCLVPTVSSSSEVRIEVVVQNVKGCTDIDQVNVEIEEVKHYYANGFSPNGDGVNDRFYLQSKKDYQFRDFAVFDRWGNRVFISREGTMNDPQFGWDGLIKGQNTRTGVFVWSAKIIGLDNSVTEIHGDITLVR